MTEEEALQRWIAAAQEAGVIGIDTETDSLDALRARLIGISLAVAPGRACYIPLRHEAAGDLAEGGAEPPRQIGFDRAVAALAAAARRSLRP